MSSEEHRVIAVLEEWFLRLEDGSANSVLPDPAGEQWSAYQCDQLIYIIDKFIEKEIVDHPCYWVNQGVLTRNKPIDTPADFNRLEGAARLAFAQDVYDVIKRVYGSVFYADEKEKEEDWLVCHNIPPNPCPIRLSDEYVV